jgi:6-phosphofructokinase 1
LNAVIRAVVKACALRKVEVRGFYDGFRGLVLNQSRLLEGRDVSDILTLGGTILGSSNKDDPFHFSDRRADGRKKNRGAEAVENLKRHRLEALLVLGGDGTLRLARRFAGMGVKIVGVPKTIDNDLWGTELSFGYHSAVEVAAEAVDRLHSVASSHHRIMVCEVMGRESGWLALGCGLSSGADLILIPELPFSLESAGRLILRRCSQGRRSSIVVVAEGARLRGRKVVSRLSPGAPEPVRLGGVGALLASALEDRCGMEARSVSLGHIVRGGTPSAFDRNFATVLGTHAVEMALSGKFSRMAALKSGRISSSPLPSISSKPRPVPLTHPMIQAASSIGVSFGT